MDEGTIVAIIVFSVVNLAAVGVGWGTVKSDIKALTKELDGVRKSVSNGSIADMAENVRQQTWREDEPARVRGLRHDMLTECQTQFTQINRQLGELKGAMDILVRRSHDERRND